MRMFAAFMLMFGVLIGHTVSQENKAVNVVREKATVFEAIKIDGKVAISVKTQDVEIIARALTIEDDLQITTLPDGIEMKQHLQDTRKFTVGEKMEIRRHFTITKIDLISLELIQTGK